MANEMMRKGNGGMAISGGSALKKSAKKAAAKKHPAKKHAAKKHAKKAAKHVGLPGGEELMGGERKGGKALRKAFHHLQRASVLISLVEKGKGGDLWPLLQFGIELYRAAVHGGGKRKGAEAAWGVLRATEHLGMAGFYEARKEHLVGLQAPVPDKDEKRLAKVRERLNMISMEQTGRWKGILPIAQGLVQRAQDSPEDPHLQWELVMAAEGLCDALESQE